MQELLEAGVHFGHQVRRGNPRMKPYIYGARDGVHIIDLAKSEELLKEAVEAAYNLGKDGKIMLLVATKKHAREIVEELAREVDTPFLTSKWVGGLLTNFDEIKKNMKKLDGLREENEKGTLTRYTKKERLLISRKVDKFSSNLGGVSKLEKIPDSLFVVDAVTESTSIKEAQRMGVTLLGFSDTNANPADFDYPIPANDDGIKSIKLICETVIRAYGEGKKVGAKNEEIRVAEQLRVKGEEDKKAAQAKLDEEAKAAAVTKEAEVLEEQIEKEIVQESSTKAA